MATIAKRFRAFMNPPDNEWESLEELRQKTRETLSRPYNLPEFKEKSEVIADTSTNPFAGIFKPFGNAVAEEESLTIARKTQRFSWVDIVAPLIMVLLVLGGVVAWQTYQRSNLQGIVSPVPSEELASENQEIAPVGEVVPPGTELEPGGPYTGTGSTQSPTNLNGSGGNTGSGGSGGETVNPICPVGNICTGEDFLGNPCSTEARCFLVRAPVGSTTAAFITDGRPAADGEPCTPERPCVIMHI